MKWIDQTFYMTDYGGVDIDSSEFTDIANASERVIDQLTQFRLSQKDLSSYPDIVQNMVKMAICAQIEYFYEMGSHTEAGMQTLQSASIGGFSFTNPSSETTNKSMRVSNVAMEYLGFTGLMYAGISSRSAGLSSNVMGFGYYAD